MKFTSFRYIIPEEEETWKSKAILSFDVDWAADEMVDLCLDLVSQAGISATFFVTHSSPVLSRLKEAENIELGIHPNFDPLFLQEEGALDADEVVGNLKSIVPQASVVRSHSMTHSGRILQLFQKHGFKHTSHFFLNRQKGIQPLRHINGLVECPVYFADDGWLYQLDENTADSKELEATLSLDSDSLRVFNFHPIHIALNTPGFGYYSKAKEEMKNGRDWQELGYGGFGARSIFESLLKAIS